MNILIAGGGTGGHINPAVAIANAAAKRDPHARILFVGTRQGLEAELVPKAGFSIRFIDAEGFLPKRSFYNVIVIGKLMIAIAKSMGILRRFRPDVVVGTGGYVSGPVLLAAHFMKIPTVIHEQNAVAGKTTRLLSRYADKICVAFPDQNILGYPEKTVITGNPVRSSFYGLDGARSKKELGLDDGLPFVLCVSGSLGAQKISETMTEFIRKHYEELSYHLMVVTGDLYYQDVLDELTRAGISLKNARIYLKNYLHDVEKYLSAADLIISRAGAIFLSEIAFLGKASLLIPSPNVAENHQEKNADAYVKQNCAVKLSEGDLNEQTLKEAIEKLIRHPAQLRKMGEQAKKHSFDRAADAIVDVINQLAVKNK